MSKPKVIFTSNDEQKLNQYVTKRVKEYADLVAKNETPMISTVSEDAFLDSFVEHLEAWLNGDKGRKVKGYRLVNGNKEYIYEDSL